MTTRWLAMALLLTTGTLAQSVEFPRRFAPQDGLVAPCEQPYRQELCLNGRWRFQPARIEGWKDGLPTLAKPDPNGWDATPIKIPSPWNVNRWGGMERHVGEGTPRPYHPSPVCFPSYPLAWDGVLEAWLNRRIQVPAEWKDRRIILHFEAVAGECQVWIDGALVGRSFEAYLPFELDITDRVDHSKPSDLTVGIVSRDRFCKPDPHYPQMQRAFPNGSETANLNGIWQDVFLLGLPAVRVADVFVKPHVDRDTLEVHVTVRNDGTTPRRLTVDCEIRPWVNLAGEDVLSAPEPRWKLDATVLALPSAQANIEPGQTATVTLKQTVGGKLRCWTPDTPHLYGALVSLSEKAGAIDTHYTRFGWRQFAIDGRQVLLNGKPIRFFGDLLHPFGPHFSSRRHVWAWYRMIKDFGGNAVRPHAQVHPRSYLDLADEMGIAVLDETAIFGSSINLNLMEPQVWERFGAHLEGLVRRDRNHPCVIGWSFGNEMFAMWLPHLFPKMPAEQKRAFQDRLVELGGRVRPLDPTRPWISCDGDEDLGGRLPVWSKHFGHGLPVAQLPRDLDKPLMVGESGGTYYAFPERLTEFNGERAYASYRGRTEALAIDIYDNIVRMALPHLAYFSPSEVAWFGIEHLNMGYHDFTRLPNEKDGIFFGAYEEGVPGIQLERLPPYLTTLNPGLDPQLPLYKPLPLFDAVKAALAKGGPQACPWDRRQPTPPRPEPAPPTIQRVAFAGAQDSEVQRVFSGLGVPFAAAEQADLLLVDAAGIDEPGIERAREWIGKGHPALVLLRDRSIPAATLASLLPAPVEITDRHATTLTHGVEDPRTRPLSLPEMDRIHVLRAGLAGPLVEQGRVLLRASDTDWEQFDGPEHDKCARMVLHEQLRKPSGAALVEWVGPNQDRRVLVSSIDYRVGTQKAVAFWRKLLLCLGIAMQPPRLTWYLPTALLEPAKAVWRYTTQAPAGNWMQSGFDDKAWSEGKAVLGTVGPKVQTRWETPDIWMRRVLELPADFDRDLQLALFHDEDVEVYLNGVLACKRTGHVTKYISERVRPEALAALRPGMNLIAVHCRQTAGGQGIDVGCFAGLATEDGLNRTKEKAHDLLRDGPMQ
mgnify:CR=1 FL=1